MHFPKFNEEFIRETDACAIVIGSLLKQKHDVIGFYGSKLNDAEKNNK